MCCKRSGGIWKPNIVLMKPFLRDGHDTTSLLLYISNFMWNKMAVHANCKTFCFHYIYLVVHYVHYLYSYCCPHLCSCCHVSAVVPSSLPQTKHENYKYEKSLVQIKCKLLMPEIKTKIIWLFNAYLHECCFSNPEVCAFCVRD